MKELVLPTNSKITQHLPLYDNEEHLWSDPPRTDPCVEVASPQKRDSIVTIVNVAWELGILTLLEGLSRVITPLSSFYCASANHVVKNHLVHVARYTFIWMPATRFFTAAARCTSTFAVVFNIATQTEYTSLALSFFLLRFAEFHTRSNDYCRFKLANLAYKFSDDGVTGVLLFGPDIRPAHRAAQKTATSCSDADYALWQSLPVCIWNGAANPMPDSTLDKLCGAYCECARSIL